MVRKTKKKSGKIDFEKERRKDKNTIIAIVIIASAVAALALVSYEINGTAKGSESASIIEGVGCDKGNSDTFHDNAHLDVFVGGHPFQVPAEIGVINGTCRYWLYTEDTSGEIHIDSPQSGQFTLGQLYNIWKATNSLPPAGTPEIYVNGKSDQSGMNGTDIGHGDEIAIIYGEKPAIIPTSYHFS